MDVLELAYTPHPAFRKRMTAPSAASSCRENTTRGLAVAAVASLALIGGTALTAAPRASEAPEISASGSRPFARREAAPASASAFLPMPVSSDPTPVETRSASPAPLLGDLGPEPEPAAVMTISASPREQHVLTSFDGTRTMTNGPAIVTVASAHPPRRALARAPVVWNRPLNWVSTH
ncbi:MAG: hypothetical protein Q8T11_16300 [Elusimicrobiota bacterium]|nr:hypothetical protein [Elusimicrobiota bacterium]